MGKRREGELLAMKKRSTATTIASPAITAYGELPNCSKNVETDDEDARVRDHASTPTIASRPLPVPDSSR
jgi:hypothetical protein